MAKRHAALTLNVVLNNYLVGKLQQQSNGAVTFHYAHSWLIYTYALPISLALPLSEEKYSGQIVYAVLDNLLPDNYYIREKIASRVSAASSRPFDLLAAIGHDCVGALQFLPEGTHTDYQGKVMGHAMNEKEIAYMMKNLTEVPLGVTQSNEFRISIAGAQEKTALLYHNQQWMLPSGTTATTHILKPQIGRLRNGIDLSQSVENEFFCLEFLRPLDVPCARSHIQDFADVRTLVIERFDRLKTKDERLLRIPQEDCCQALGVSSNRKYESEGGPNINDILELLKMSDDVQYDRFLFFKVQIIYWLLAATDGHAKNFSIALYPGGHFRLTPMYDVMSAQPYLDQGQIQHNKMKLAMAVGKSRHYVVNKILLKHFIQMGEQNGFSLAQIKKIIEELNNKIPLALEKTFANLPKDFPEPMAVSIANGVKKRFFRLRDDTAY